MVSFFKGNPNRYYAIGSLSKLNSEDFKKLKWLFGDAEYLDTPTLMGFFVGPRKEMITPWSTNAVEITQNMGIKGIGRIEEHFLFFDWSHKRRENWIWSLRY
jgi:phosphoribosylformylglycinamidine synthase